MLSYLFVFKFFNDIYIKLYGNHSVTRVYRHTSNALGDAIEIAAGEAWMGRVNNIVDDFRIISGQADAAGTADTVNSSTSVRCTVAAIIDDGGH